MSKSVQFEFSNARYEFSHGKAPRGVGYWAFDVRADFMAEETIFAPGGKSLSDAKAWIKAEMRRRAAALGRGGRVLAMVAP